MNDRNLIWEAYHNLYENLEFREVKVLNRFLQSYYSNGRILLTNKDKIDNTRVTQTPQHQTYNPKPKGLWYALANEWVQFIKNESPQWASDYTNVFLLDIDYNQVLKIDTSEKLENFNQQYANDMFVDWGAVQQEGYKGVEIIPYQYQYRHTMGWYYGWDLASGCIWDTSCITNTTKLYPRVKENRATKPGLSSNTSNTSNNVNSESPAQAQKLSHHRHI